MAWSSLGTQFCLELAFGLLLGLCFVPKAPLGTFFYRLMGTTALLPLLVAFAAPPLFAEGSWTDPAGLAALGAALAFPFVSGPLKGSRRLVALIWSTACTGLALGLTVAGAPEVQGTGGVLLATASAMATGTVAGGVGLAMVVGHWYLTVPQLPVSLLARLNKVTIWAMVCSAVLVGWTCFTMGSELGGDRPLLESFGLFHLGARVATGLALPLLFAWMTAGSLQYQNTRSATGILYASTVLVLIGSALSISLQDSYGFPL